MNAKDRIKSELVINIQKLALILDPKQCEAAKSKTFYIQLCVEDKLTKEKIATRYTTFASFNLATSTVDWKDEEKIVLGQTGVVVLKKKRIIFTVFSKANDKIEFIGKPFIIKLKVSVSYSQLKIFSNSP